MKQPARSAKKILSATAAALLILGLSGCEGGRTSPSSTARSGGGTTASAQTTLPTQYNLAAVIKTGQKAPDGFRSMLLTFYDHTPMQCNMVVPEEWELRPVNDTKIYYADSPVDIYVANRRVGYIGNHSYVKEEVDEEKFESIYHDLMGAHYNWYDGFTLVAETKTASTAICKVVTDREITGDGTTRYGDGILSCDKTLARYVQIEIGDGLLTQERLRIMAASIVLSSVSPSTSLTTASTIASSSGTGTTAQPTLPTWNNQAEAAETVQTAPDGFRSVRLAFYDHTPMQCDMVVPEGWELRPLNDTKIHAAYSPVDIYIANKKVGYVGNWDYGKEFNPEYEIDESNPTYYVSIYSQLMLNAHCNWNNDYTPVRRTDAAVSATCRVFYDKNLTEDGKVHYNDGILSYDKTLGKYIQMEIEDGLLTKDQLHTIAESIRLAPIS